MSTLRAFLLAPLLLIASVTAALAHGAPPGGPTSGISIPSVSHGEMSVIAEHRADIIALGSNAIDTNEDFRRVLNFAEIEYAYCLWGKMPGSVSDENSPFNECSHAYLAATKDVLLRMRAMPVEKQAAEQIISDIDVALVQRQLSLILCQFSAESFNTANILRPEWSAVPFHAASMASLTALLLAVCGGIWGIRRASGGAA